MKDIKSILEEADLENVVGGSVAGSLFAGGSVAGGEFKMTDKTITALTAKLVKAGYSKEEVMASLTKLAKNHAPISFGGLVEQLNRDLT